MVKETSTLENEETTLPGGVVADALLDGLLGDPTDLDDLEF